MFERIWRASLAPLFAAVAAILISSIALLISGNDPIEAFREMWKTIDSTESVVIIINRAVPYYIAGVAVAIGFKMNLFNIGSNGQYLLAALIAGWAGAEVSLPPVLHVAFVFLVAITVGGTWALIAAILNVTRNVNVVISTIMLNYIAIGLVGVPAHRGVPRRGERRPRRADQADAGVGSAPLAQPAHRTRSASTSPRESSCSASCPFAIVLGIAYYVLLNRSRFGYDLRLSGLNPDAALVRRRQPEADGADHAVHVGRRRRHDRPAVPALRSELPQVRRRLPDHHRLHRPRHRAARSEQPRRHRRGGDRVGRPSNGRRSASARSASRRRSAGSCRDRSCSPPSSPTRWCAAATTRPRSPRRPPRRATNDRRHRRRWHRSERRHDGHDRHRTGRDRRPAVRLPLDALADLLHHHDRPRRGLGCPPDRRQPRPHLERHVRRRAANRGTDRAGRPRRRWSPSAAARSTSASTA